MSNGGRITTELDIELAKLKLKTEEAKAQFRSLSKAAEDTKLGEKMEAGMKKSTVMEFRGMKEAAEKSAAEAAKAAAAKWKEIVTPAVTDSWRMHDAGSGGGMTGFGAFGRGRRGGAALQNASFQIQDAGVQLGMGTSLTQVVGQQAPQLLSSAGPMGAAAGAVVAVGAALVAMGQKGKEQFEALEKEGLEFGKSMETLIATGDVSSLMAGYEKWEDRLKKIRAVGEEANSVMGQVKGALAEMMGSVSNEEKAAAISKQEAEALKLGHKLKKEILASSREDLEIAKARAAGQDELVSRLEREKELVAEIAKIKDSDLPDNLKNELIANATEASRVTGEAESEARWKEAADRRIQASEQYAKAEHAVEVAGMTAAQKLVDLNKQRLELEKRIKAESNEEKKYQLATQRKEVELQIVNSQMALSKEGENAYKTRQEYIAGLQKDLEGKEKSLAELKNPAPTQTFRGAGALSSQFDWMFGGGSALVSESTDKNTAAIKEHTAAIDALREKLTDLNVNTTAVFQS